MEDTKLQKYIKKLLEIQEENKNKPLKLSELREIALSGGIEEFEWDEMMQQADKNVKVAQNHFFYKNYQDAFDTAVETLNINPYHTQALIIASDAALKIYETEDDEKYLDKAELYAKEVLKHSPAEKRAFEILAKIDKFENKEEQEKKKKLYYSLAVGIAIFIIILGIVAIKNMPHKVSENTRNLLIEKQEEALSQWAQVENVMSRRDNLIPQLVTLFGDDNDMVLQYISEIDSLKNLLQQSDSQQRIEVQRQIQLKIQEMTAKIIGNGNNSDDMELIMVQIEGTYNRISVETKRYNDLAKEYNILLKQNSVDFPDFTELAYYQQ